MADDDARAGEELARAWLQGMSELVDDLSALVDGMPRRELGPVERGFLRVVGEAARRAVLALRTASAAPRPPDLAKAQPLPEAPLVPRIDIDEFRRRRREHELAARLDELGRRNAELFMVQGRGIWGASDCRWMRTGADGEGAKR